MYTLIHSQLSVNVLKLGIVIDPLHSIKVLHLNVEEMEAIITEWRKIHPVPKPIDEDYDLHDPTDIYCD